MRKTKPLGIENNYYKEILTVTLGGVEFKIYGSMSWTVSQTKKHPWEEIRAAYIELTGDTRENVNRDDAANVVAGELQLSWAQATGREDLLDTLRKNQQKRVKFAVESTEPEKGSGRKRASTRRTTQGGSMSETATKEKRIGVNGATIPSRGGMGLAVKLIDEGERDEATIVAKVEEAFPDIKNPTRHIRYVARIMGVELVRPPKQTAKAEEAPEEASEE